MIPKLVTDNAACKGRNADTEFYRSADSVKNVKQFEPLPQDHVCFTCPVMVECGEYGIHNEEYGTWGGMKEYELAIERKRRGISIQSRYVPDMKG